MASSKNYLQFVLEQLSELQEIKSYTASTIISGGQFSDGLGDDENGN